MGPLTGLCLRLQGCEGCSTILREMRLLNWGPDVDLWHALLYNTFGRTRLCTHSAGAAAPWFSGAPPAAARSRFPPGSKERAPRRVQGRTCDGKTGQDYYGILIDLRHLSHFMCQVSSWFEITAHFGREALGAMSSGGKTSSALVLEIVGGESKSSSGSDASSSLFVGGDAPRCSELEPRVSCCGSEPTPVQ